MKYEDNWLLKLGVVVIWMGIDNAVSTQTAQFYMLTILASILFKREEGKPATFP